MSDLVGRRLGSYHLFELVRGGRLTSVYRGVAADGADVRVTVLERLGRRKNIDAALAEALAVSRLRHPNIAPVLLAGEEDGYVFLAAEPQTWRALGELPRAALDVATAVGIVVDVLQGLEHAHRSGVVHRSVTATHIAIAPPFRPVLTDFAIGHEQLAEESSTDRRMILGTPAYLAPEQAFGLPAEPRTDVYSAGVVLFELLTGRVPFEGDDPVAVLRAHVSNAPPSLLALRADVPTALDATLSRALAKDPADRQETAAAFIDELTTALTPGMAARAVPTPGHDVPFEDPLAEDYRAGVRAFSAGRWQEAVELLTGVAAVDLGYEDVEDLLRTAEEALGLDDR